MHDQNRYFCTLTSLIKSKDKEQTGFDKFGEDAFYLNKSLSDYDSYGVADGVGGWRNQGVDPRLVTRAGCRSGKFGPARSLERLESHAELTHRDTYSKQE